MATKKTTTTTKASETSAKGGHASRVNWKELYQDLPENVAKILREKRVKPEQLTTKTDGEILALGLSDVDLETIRAKYKPEISQQPSTVGKEAKTEEVKPVAIQSESHFHKFPRQVYGRSKRYKALASKLGRNQSLTVAAAIEKLAAIAGDSKNIDLHLNVTETGLRGEVKVPFSTGKTFRIEIFSDKTITAMNNNEFNFDVLLATPADMGKLARYAKVLGPKGLMPNPKNGTIIADPAARAKQMSAGAIIAYKTEPKFPIIHISLGKTSQKLEELTANLTALLKEIGVSKIQSAYLTSNQTPSLKLELTSL